MAGADGRPRPAVGMTSPAEGDAATAAALRGLARASSPPASAVHLVRGPTSRLKQIRLTGNAATITARLQRLYAADGATLKDGHARRKIPDGPVSRGAIR